MTHNNKQILNVKDELKRIRALLDQHNIKSKTKPYYVEYPIKGYSLDIIFFRRLLNAFKSTKIKEVDASISDSQLILEFQNAKYVIHL